MYNYIYIYIYKYIRCLPYPFLSIISPSPKNYRFLFDKDPASLGNSFPRKGRTNDSPNQHLGLRGCPWVEGLSPYFGSDVRVVVVVGCWLLVVGCWWFQPMLLLLLLLLLLWLLVVGCWLFWVVTLCHFSFPELDVYQFTLQGTNDQT